MIANIPDVYFWSLAALIIGLVIGLILGGPLERLIDRWSCDDES